jgi:YgiT-type zinc finger domain-containing protein
MPVFAIEVGAMTPVEHECPQCGSTRLHETLVKSAFWQDERLVVVDNIPAVVCEACGERLYDDATVTALDLMQGDGFQPDDAQGHMHVPIFSFAHRVPPELIKLAETQE